METLSKRELQVADLIHQGCIEKEIAKRLFLSQGTMHTHKKRLFTKLNARNIADVTRIYLTRLAPGAAIVAIALAIFALCHIAGIEIMEAAKTFVKHVSHVF